MMRLYVGNLSNEVTGADLQGVFAAYGKVDSVHIVTDAANGESRGFGFVEMRAQAEAANAIRALDQTRLKGRWLKVSRARPRNDGASPATLPTGWAVVGDGRHRW